MWVKQLVRRVRWWCVCGVRRGHIVWRRHGLERILRLFGCVSVIAVLLLLVLVLVLVVRHGRRRLDSRDIVRVVADVLFLACEPLAYHRLVGW